MRIKSIELLPLAIPFTQDFSHASFQRKASDSFLMKLTSAEGVVGYGEGLVRPYVTGETMALVSALFKPVAQALLACDWEFADPGLGPELSLAPLNAQLDAILAPYVQAHKPVVIALGGLRCALELALIDALLRSSEKCLSDLLPPRRDQVVYSAIISAGEEAKVLKLVRHCMLLGLTDYKLKVTPQTKPTLVGQVRALLGPTATLRLDANSAFSVDEALAFVAAVQAFGISAIEQPVPRAPASAPLGEALARIHQKNLIPVMADESLITLDDAEALLASQAVGFFNIRLAKCGGLLPSYKLAMLARKAGVKFQLGCLVGETAILSAVARHLAAHLPDCAFVEGSLGNLLLKEDLATQSIRFAHGGKAPILTRSGRGPLGFGIELSSDTIRRYTLAACSQSGPGVGAQEVRL